jgi:hypothetical protein
MSYPKVTCFDVLMHAMLYLLGASSVVCFAMIAYLEYWI